MNSGSAAGVPGGDESAAGADAVDPPPPKLMICNASSSEAASRILDDYMNAFEARLAKTAAAGATGSVGELVIDGKTLNHILNTEAEWTLAELASRCRSVVVCRASPRQKVRLCG